LPQFSRETVVIVRQRWLFKIYTLPKQIPGYAPGRWVGSADE